MLQQSGLPQRASKVSKSDIQIEVTEVFEAAVLATARGWRRA